MALGGGGVTVFLAGVFAILKCDDVCDDGSPGGWRDESDAWQWSAQVVLAVVATGLMVAGAVLLFRRDPGRGGWIFAVGVAGALGWAAWMIPS